MSFEFVCFSLLVAIPASAQGLGRRSSMNAPKPPPPVRRSSSISAQSPAVIQKYRSSPPRQLNTQNAPPPVSAKPTNAQNNQSNHRRSLSASGSNSEHTYAELSEIQASIQARQQQQQGHYATGQGYTGVYGPGAMSAPATPQYAQPVTTPNPIVNSNVVNSLNTRFTAMNTQIVNNNQSQQQSQYSSSKNTQSVSTASGGGMPDLPPPPSEDELQEMEQIYNVPKTNIQQTQAYNAQTNVSNVQMRHGPSQTQGVIQAQPGSMRISLISEMKAGNKFRKMSNSEGDSEC